jgi:predicted house-cleaning noncanonical NTP pyrophosphatase (MazG superfamily)
LEIYNKAIRDKIPEIIKASGKEPKTRQLPNAEFLSKLEEKLVEELKEYQDSKSPEELADILEVIYRIGQLKGSDLEKIRIKKNQDRGAFEKNLFLIQVDDE